MACIRFAMAAGLLCLTCGCGTTNNLVMMHYHQPPSGRPGDYEPMNYLYGGVKFDLNAVQNTFSKEEIPLPYRLFGPFFLADLPLSLVCDTLYLPITIPATIREAEYKKQTSEATLAEIDEERKSSRDGSAASTSGRKSPPER